MFILEIGQSWLNVENFGIRKKITMKLLKNEIRNCLDSEK